ncbi:hypothetical protein BLA39750_01070 [Burkholderia lata]|uniref:Uncharacterized protein n=1 Tax=Burkholderia lata (strain ATCC 17760 / DSM 23089 / LMG 22485 / NCIMB 9086 / R18194 / 383) TaxID=482957 RepID=A0A6P2UZA3_BURL3|nr:hypothetical protein [Burkholderia lata]VWC79186.1 hypothetical protein BLA39750_01070 [Burkholderia lata]
MTKNSNAVEKQPHAEQTPWQRDDVQFPRLLAEILATQDTLDMTALAQSMDLSVDEVSAVFDRSETAWEAIKADTATPPDRDPPQELVGDAERMTQIAAALALIEGEGEAMARRVASPSEISDLNVRRAKLQSERARIVYRRTRSGSMDAVADTGGSNQKPPLLRESALLFKVVDLLEKRWEKAGSPGCAVELVLAQVCRLREDETPDDGSSVASLFREATELLEAWIADGDPASEEETGILNEVRQEGDAIASNPDQPEVSDEDIAFATAAGFRVDLATAVDGGELKLRYWWTRCPPDCTRCETSQGSFPSKKLAWQDAVATLLGAPELKESASAILNTEASDADTQRDSGFAVAYRSLVRKWKSESQGTRVQWPSVAKAILYRIESNSPIEALSLLKADQEKVSGFSVASYYQSAIDDVECLIVLQELECQSERIVEVAAAPADTTLDLSNIEADVLLYELRRRGLVVSAWGLEDAATPLENDDETEDLTDEQFAQLEEKLLEKASVSLEDVLTSRGNEHFAIIWDTQRARMLEDVRGNTSIQGNQ